MIPPDCPRCGEPMRAGIGSYFTAELICLDCSDKERAHPDFERARQVENEAVRNGDYNFPGIGRPADL